MLSHDFSVYLFPFPHSGKASRRICTQARINGGWCVENISIEFKKVLTPTMKRNNPVK
jgi:hypothetical protein